MVADLFHRVINEFARCLNKLNLPGGKIAAKNPDMAAHRVFSDTISAS
jgi:hypothetical protein